MISLIQRDKIQRKFLFKTLCDPSNFGYLACKLIVLLPYIVVDIFISKIHLDHRLLNESTSFLQNIICLEQKVKLLLFCKITHSMSGISFSRQLDLIVQYLSIYFALLMVKLKLKFGRENFLHKKNLYLQKILQFIHCCWQKKQSYPEIGDSSFWCAL